MPTFILTGTLPEKTIKGYMKKPEDRTGPLGELVAAAGGTLKQFYYTTGDTDFMMVIDAPGPEVVAKASMVAGAAGMAADFKTVRAWTGAEFAKVAGEAAEISESYRKPGN